MQGKSDIQGSQRMRFFSPNAVAALEDTLTTQSLRTKLGGIPIRTLMNPAGGAQS